MLILRTSWRSLTFREGKFRLRNWSRGRFRPFAAADNCGGVEVGSGEMVDGLGRERGVMAQGGGNRDEVDPTDKESCDGEVAAGFAADTGSVWVTAEAEFDAGRGVGDGLTVYTTLVASVAD